MFLSNKPVKPIVLFYIFAFFTIIIGDIEKNLNTEGQQKSTTLSLTTSSDSECSCGDKERYLTENNSINIFPNVKTYCNNMSCSWEIYIDYSHPLDFVNIPIDYSETASFLTITNCGEDHPLFSPGSYNYYPITQDIKLCVLFQSNLDCDSGCPFFLFFEYNYSYNIDMHEVNFKISGVARGFI